jgi:hypothetical protein
VTRRNPENLVCVEIPDCRMEASTTRDRTFLFQLGWPHDTTTLVFQRRRALRRFIRIANEILAAPSPDHATADTSSTIVSSPE